MEEILHQLIGYPIIYRVLYIPGGAGFLPSTVYIAVFVFLLCVVNWVYRPTHSQMIICLFLESVPDRSSVYFLGLRWLYNLLFVRKHGFDVVETHQFFYQHIAHKSFFSLTKRLCFEMMPTNLLHILSIINIQMHHGLQVFFCISFVFSY